MGSGKIKIWLKAFRLRTLPLALSNALMGSFLALAEGGFRWSVFILSILTITFLQILSNLANDYGDAVSGADNVDRIGPQRVTQSGLVTRKEMKAMISTFIALSCISGTALILIGLDNLSVIKLAVFFLLGLAAVIAAIKYTIGKNPYGYKGFGDIFVFIFFGLVGVMGTYYLHTHWFDLFVIIPASVIGLMSTAVLNINNLRDIKTDKESGKNTIPVKLGAQFSQYYHLLLILSALLISIVYTLHDMYSGWQLLFLLTVPLFSINLWRVFHYKNSEELNNELKNLALTIFLFSLTFGAGLVI